MPEAIIAHAETPAYQSNMYHVCSRAVSAPRCATHKAPQPESTSAEFFI